MLTVGTKCSHCGRYYKFSDTLAANVFDRMLSVVWRQYRTDYCLLSGWKIGEK